MTAQRLHNVTGAAGYTSKYITQLLLRPGHRVQSITGHPDRETPFNFDQPEEGACQRRIHEGE